MREYFGSGPKKYYQPSDKYYRLFPALNKILSKMKGKNTVDVGCGGGLIFELFGKYFKEYLGTDISSDMIVLAKKKHPKTNFIVSPAENLTRHLTRKFDLAILNMLFPSIDNLETFNRIFLQVGQVLNPGGYFVVGTTHPHFDGYMQAGIMNRQDIETKFRGYFYSAQNYVVNRKEGEKEFSFSDYHWQLTDYLRAATAAGFILDHLDECRPVKSLIRDPAKKKVAYKAPFNLVLVFQKR